MPWGTSSGGWPWGGPFYRPVTADTLRAARGVRARHADLRLNLADAVTVAVAAEVDTDAILTLDERDFRAVRPLTGHAAFRLLPADHQGGA